MLKGIIKHHDCLEHATTSMSTLINNYATRDIPREHITDESNNLLKVEQYIKKYIACLKNVGVNSSY